MNITTNNNLKCTIALAALEGVTDPEIGLNVVDLGLIYEITFEENDKVIFAKMTLSTQFCPMGEVIVNSVERALQNIFSEETINVSLTFNPPWTHDRISEEGKKFLNQK